MSEIEERLRLACDCGDDKEHLVDFQYWNDVWADTVSISTSMNHCLPWYKRLKIGIMYVLGVDNTYSHYVESMHTQTQMIQLRDWLNAVIPKMAEDTK